MSNFGVVTSITTASGIVTAKSGVVAGSSGTFLVSQGATSEPQWNAMSGDATLAATGAVTIGNNKVTYAKMQQASTVTLLGNPTGSTANIEEITLGSGLSFSGTTLVATGGTVTLTGDVTGSGTGSITTTVTPENASLLNAHRAFFPHQNQVSSYAYLSSPLTLGSGLVDANAVLPSQVFAPAKVRPGLITPSLHGGAQIYIMSNLGSNNPTAQIILANYTLSTNTASQSSPGIQFSGQFYEGPSTQFDDMITGGLGSVQAWHQNSGGGFQQGFYFGMDWFNTGYPIIGSNNNLKISAPSGVIFTGAVTLNTTVNLVAGLVDANNVLCNQVFGG